MSLTTGCAKCSAAASCSGRPGTLWNVHSVRAANVRCRAASDRGDPSRSSASKEEELTLVNLGPQYQIPQPELGPLEQRVETTFVEGLFSDEVSIADTDYWFTEPEGGWNSRDVWAISLPEVDPDPITATHFGSGRTELSDLEEGTVLTGEVVCLMYYHGVQVDIGAQYDGLIPVRHQEWVDDHFRSKYGVCTGVADDFEIGQQVTVRIHKVNHRRRCRWPIQLTVIDPDVQHKLTSPDEWKPPFDLRGVRSYKEAFEITGRPIPGPEATRMITPEHIAEEDLYYKRVTMRNKGMSKWSYGQQAVDFDAIGPSKDVFEAPAHDIDVALEQEADISEDDESYEEDYSAA